MTRLPFVSSRLLLLLPLLLPLILFPLLLPASDSWSIKANAANARDPSDPSKTKSENTPSFPSALPLIKRSFTSPVIKETFHVLAECIDTDNAYTLLKVDIPPNVTSVPLHHHYKYDEHLHILEGVFHTTTHGVRNRTYHDGESLTFPQQVQHLWWTEPETACTVLLKMEPCFDGFHELIEIYSNIPKEWYDPSRPEFVKDFWTTAVLFDIGGTSIDAAWYQSIMLWIFKQMAKSAKGQRLKEELRSKYLHVMTTTGSMTYGEGTDTDERISMTTTITTDSNTDNEL
jgi:quercetin dioxygenase-like cupin family protein